MASYCMLCDKKIGFFAAFGEDILTGKSGNKICEDCFQKAETIVKKIEMKIPFEKEDFEGFSEKGKEEIENYLKIYGITDPMKDISEDIEDIIPEVGEATIGRSFEVDQEETMAVLEKIEGMTDTQIEKFLEGIVSENDTADGFMREILSLNDEELAFVLSEQRELYNNAEWAYIMLVERRRAAIMKAVTNSQSTQYATEEIDDEGVELNSGEVKRMTERLKSEEKEELEKILCDPSFTPEARAAAKELLKTKK